MIIGYIRESKSETTFAKRIKLKLKQIFNVIDVVKEAGHLFYYLPVLKNSELTKHKIKRMVNKLSEKFGEEGINNVVLSKYLGTVDNFKNQLYSENINILDGRYLFKALIYECIEYILKVKKKQIELRRSININQ